LASRLPPEAFAAEQKTYITYTLSFLDEDSPPTITVLEARNLLLASGTTGFRTWEACLHLSAWLSSPSCFIDLKGKNILELGSGTGYLSIFCLNYLNAAHVTATDGSDEVVSHLTTNFYLNGLQDNVNIEAKELKWGHVLLGGEQAEWNKGREIDIILAADVIYDSDAQPALVATMVDLTELYPKALILMASTMRNEKTWDNFVKICESNGFLLEMLDFPVMQPEKQEGPFYWEGFPILLNIVKKRSLS
jgi:predicted nicotinamide N-methyase